MSVTSWYSQQYLALSRAAGLRQPPYLARVGTNISAVATSMAQQNQNTQQDANAAIVKDKKIIEPLFGPSIGSVSSGPSWTLSSEKKVLTDELTPDIVSSWIEKSKEPSQPTTTLQALVNLKRPTLRLSPLSAIHEDPSTTEFDQHQHGLEFEYDCDAPKCGIYVHVYLPKSHPDAPSTSSHQHLAKLLVFETVVEGGFGNRLKLEEGALLELGRFEHSISGPSKVEPVVGEPSSLGDAAPVSHSTDGQTSRSNPRKRFTNFAFRRRPQNHSVSGPALAVVDAEPVVSQEMKPKDAKDEVEEGVKITIRLAALDEQGTELASINEQVTYLDIFRFGQKAADIPEAGENIEDIRPWVVRVVKREATIGPHTFHLHEIFGLASSSSHNAAPIASPPPPTHSYPPDESQRQVITVAAEDQGPQSECLLCLSSPREVVLLPCRHLVACKDCALNMVEFGAGGNITQPTEPILAAGGADEAVADAAGGAIGQGTTYAATPIALNPANNQRRKRKAKGWFCPVCRQPYTSMLRLTTAPPPSDHKDEGSGTEDEGMPATPEPVHTHNSGPIATDARGGGLLGSSLRPGFLRGFSLGRTSASDVENQNAQVRA